MKLCLSWMVLAVLSLPLVACKKKEQAVEMPPPSVPEVPVEEPAVPVAPPVVEPVRLMAEQRAEMHGFARYLPGNTEWMVTLHNRQDAVARLEASRLWRALTRGSPLDDAVEDGVDALDDPFGDEELVEDELSPAAVFGREVTVAIGDRGGERIGDALHFFRLGGYFLMRNLVKSYAAQLDGNEQGEDVDDFWDESLKDLFVDDASFDGGQSGMDVFEAMRMPPVFISFRVGENMREQAAHELASLLQMLDGVEEGVRLVEVQYGNSLLSGYELSGALIAKGMEEGRAEMEEDMSAERADRLIKAVAQKKLVLMTGVIDEYVVFFLGSSVEELKLAPGLDESLVAGDALAFADAYAGKHLLAVVYAEEESSQQLMKQGPIGFADMGAGLRDGLSAVDQLGDTRSLQALLRMVEEREAALYGLAKMAGLGTVVFFDEGVKLETYGGCDVGMLDWTSPNRLAPLAQGEDVLMFANMTTDAVFDAKAHEYVEVLMETAYAAAMKMADFPVQDQDLIEFWNGSKLFDAKFRDDLVAVWNAYSEGVGASLGKERALVVDLKGVMPALPDVPRPLIGKAKFPRVSMVAPVVDRAKLAASWQEMSVSLGNLMSSAGELAGMDLPMQRQMGSEKGGFTTWFLSMPFCNDEFVPSVSVNDEWFAVSTSKNQAVDLLSQAMQGGATSTGFQLLVNFKALDKVGEETLQLVEQNRDGLGITAEQMNDARLLVEGLKDLDALSVHVRRESGQLRGSVHLKTR